MLVRVRLVESAPRRWCRCSGWSTLRQRKWCPLLFSSLLFILLRSLFLIHLLSSLWPFSPSQFRVLFSFSVQLPFSLSLSESTSDFRPNTDQPNNDQLSEHYHKYHEPIGNMKRKMPHHIVNCTIFQFCTFDSSRLI